MTESYGPLGAGEVMSSYNDYKSLLPIYVKIYSATTALQARQNFR